MKIALIVISTLFVIMMGCGYAIFFTSLKDKFFARQNPSVQKEEKIDLLEITFVQLPEMIVNLKTSNKGKPNILKATFILELIDAKDKDEIDHLRPLIMDQFLTYLRELSLQDIEGAGLLRMRNELKNRVLNVVSPIKIRDILFKEFLTQ